MPANIVLIVDSDLVVREAVSARLRDCGYVVVEASSTDEAELILNDDKLRADVILCDAAARGRRSASAFRLWVKYRWPGVAFALGGGSEAVAQSTAEGCEQVAPMIDNDDAQDVVIHIRRLLQRR